MLYGCGYRPARHFWGSVYLPAPAVSLDRSSDYTRPEVLPPDEFWQSPTGPTPVVPVVWAGSPGMAYTFCRKWYDRRFRRW